jgi:hypothetical protein
VSRIAWLAGLWDGEGSVGVTLSVAKGRRKGSPYLTPAIQLSMTCKVTIDAATAVLLKSGVSATSYSYREKDPKKHLDAHYLHVGRLGDIAITARLLLPHSVTKRKQWAAMLEYVESRLSTAELLADGRVKRGGNVRRPFTAREIELARVLRALNARGPAARKKEAKWLERLSALPRA